MNWLVKKWYSNNFFCILLTPFSGIYRFIVFVRHLLFQLKLKKTTSFPIPIIIVGNITVGGTGKTPLVIWLTKFLQANGFRPAIVSRGHGGFAPHYPYVVTAASAPAIVGDEAVLIVQGTDCPMVIAPNRVLAVQTLLDTTNCNVIISDDGLQHYAMARDVEIAVIDGERRFGNGFCLPAGPLREPIKRLKEVDFVVCNGIAQAGEYAMNLISQSIYNLAQPQLILDIKKISQPVHAVAGIGNPQRFFNSLRQQGLTLIEHIFPDHYLFKKHDLEFGDDALIIMTEKDAVKCQNLDDQRLWCLPIVAQLQEKFATNLLTRLLVTGSS